MAHSTVVLDCDEFARAFLPQSVTMYNPANSSRHQFSPLEHADASSGREISELVIQAFNDDRLAAGSKISYFRPYLAAVSSTSITNAAIFDAEHALTRTQPSWVEQRVPILFCRHFVGSDPFDTASYDDECGEIKMERSKVFDHLNAVVELLFAAQHRVFLFFLVVIGRRFRLLRWDRAGIITTPSIDYYEQPDVLCDCIWRLSHLDDVALGFDPSATRVLPGNVDYVTMDFAALQNPNDADHAERALRDDESTDPTTFEYARTLFRNSLASDWPRFKVQIPSRTTYHNFLIGRPTFHASGVFGRGTRGYVALDCNTGRFVWLKDAWRTSHILSGTEGDILQKLNDTGIQNIPTLLCHGDVHDQHTVTGEWWECAQSLSSLPSPPCTSSSPPSSCTLTGSTSPSSRKRKRVDDGADEPTLHSQCDIPLRQHKHYRIVIAEVALPLDHFRNGKQLASIVLDAMEAHYQAATNPTTLILHRDISGGNILIYPRVERNKDGVHTMVWGGILSDWELSKPVDDEYTPSKATQAEQVGTYQFMSVNLLSHPSKPVKISDELESFFHVLVYYSIRYLRSNCAHPMSYIDNYFNNYAGPGRLHTCGWKSLAIEVDEWLSTRFPHRPLLFQSPMDDILGSLLSCFQVHYKVMKDDFAKTGPPLPEFEQPPPDPSGKGLAPIAVRKIIFFDEDDDDNDGHISDDSSDVDDDDDTPTPEERDRARQILDHTFVLDHVATIARSLDWPEDDRIPSSTARPSPPRTAAGDSDASLLPPSSHKRRRIAGPEPIVSLPARLHRSTRRTRMQPRTMPIRMR
ncbi:hypothetical protein GSI_05191 [Ganoderma sinense ZZ0214-1]|uniref:Protein kinase domain-containing protein n=1 Tax=Ganoderma sinense ZZ0214-1 TaxID=1077348 RepID=A0A2G8SFX6_9APHY|nr:hypothetical protein GSI_05191 [Ganoderma sinense ZZ0214-1]